MDHFMALTYIYKYISFKLEYCYILLGKQRTIFPFNVPLQRLSTALLFRVWRIIFQKLIPSIRK